MTPVGIGKGGAPCRGAGRAGGFSLVELMVAAALGLILTAGVITVLVNTSRSHAELGNSARQIESGRYAMQTLADDIRHAGFFGNFYLLQVPAALPDPCAVGLPALRAAIGVPIQGYAGAGSSPIACLPGYVPNTDVLVIRRAATVATAFDPDADTPVDQLVPGAVYLQSIPAQFILNLAAASGNSGIFTLTQRDRVGGVIRSVRAPVRRFLVRLYYIRACSDCSGSGDGIPTLTRVELQNGALSTATPAPISEGVQDLQVRYGVDSSGNGPPDAWVSLPSTVKDWFDVVAVEVNLLVRTAEPVPGYTDTKGYVLGDVSVTAAADAFKRHVLTSVVRVVNSSARREK